MKYLIILLSLLLIGCGEAEDQSSENEKIFTEKTVNLTGCVQDALCLSGGSVSIYPLDSADLLQTGAAYSTLTTGDFGAYVSSGKVTNQYFEIVASVACKNEITGATMDFKELRALIDVNANEHNNINPLTTATIAGIRLLYNKSTPTLGYATYQNFALSKLVAEGYLKEELFRVFGETTSFTDMSINTDAFLLAANTALLYNKTVAEQIGLLSDIGQDILDGVINDPDVLSHISEASQNIDFPTVKRNVETMYSEADQTIDVPQFWNYLDSDWDGVLNATDPDQAYLELMSRVPVLQKTLNLDDTCTAHFDTDGFSWFAIPFRFDSSITLSKYIGLNLEGNISIYTRTFDTYDKPGTLVFTLGKIKDNFFVGDFQDTTGDTYSNLPTAFHGSIDGHGLTAGADYYIVIHRDDQWRLSKSCNGPLVAFGRVLASVDGVDWIGHDNNTPFFRRQGVKMFLTD